MAYNSAEELGKAFFETGSSEENEVQIENIKFLLNFQKTLAKQIRFAIISLPSEKGDRFEEKIMTVICISVLLGLQIHRLFFRSKLRKRPGARGKTADLSNYFDVELLNRFANIYTFHDRRCPCQ